MRRRCSRWPVSARSWWARDSSARCTPSSRSRAARRLFISNATLVPQRRDRAQLRIDLGERPRAGRVNSTWRCARANSGRRSPTRCRDVGFRANGSLTLLKTRASSHVADSRAGARGREPARLRVADARRGPRPQPRARGEVRRRVCCARATRRWSRELRSGALRDAMTATGRYEYLAGRELVGSGGRRGCWTTAVSVHRATRSGSVWARASQRLRRRTLRGGSATSRSTPTWPRPDPSRGQLTTSVANGDSFRYYPGFRDDAERPARGPQESLASTLRDSAAVPATTHGGLTIGDTHEAYDARGSSRPLTRPMDLIVSRPRAVCRRRPAGDRTALERRLSPDGLRRRRAVLPPRSRARRDAPSRARVDAG